MSSSRMAAPRRGAARGPRSTGGAPATAAATRRIRSSAQKRLTAVGRVPASPLIARPRDRASRRIERRWRDCSRGQGDAERGGHADRRRAADHQRANRVGRRPPSARRPARARCPGSRRLIEQDQAVVLPANGRDGSRHASEPVNERRAARGSGRGVRPATRTSLSRPRVPCTMVTAEGRRRREVASSADSGRRWPAGDRRRGDPDAERAVGAPADDLVCDRPGLDAHAQQSLRHRAVVRTARPDRPRRTRRGASAGSARASRPNPPTSCRRSRRSAWISTRSCASSLRAASTAFSPRSSASRTIRSASRLAASSSPRPGAGWSRACPAELRSRSITPRWRSSWAASCSFSSCVLLEERLVVLGHVFEEGVDLLGVGATEHPDRELLLADVVRTDAHRKPPLAISGSTARSRNELHQKRLEEVDRQDDDHRRRSRPI